MKNIKICSAAAAAMMLLTGGASVFGYAEDDLYTAAGFSSTEISLAELLVEKISLGSQSINTKSYGLDFSEFEALYGAVMLNQPALFNVSVVDGYITYGKDNTTIIEYQPRYFYSDENAEKIQKKIDAYMKKLMSGIDSNWCDAEKVLYVHDYLASDIVYTEPDSKYEGRSIYDAMIKGEAVCVGYALSFKYVMDEMKLPCICVYNSNHIWNMVEIDDEWYHVDVTWDDAAHGCDGYVEHSMLLLSDNEMLTTEPVHEIWTFGMNADSDKYNNSFWTESNSQMTYLDGWWYYTTKDGICRYSFAKNQKETLYEFTKDWIKDSGHVFVPSFSTPTVYNNKIYFNTSTEIMCYNPKNGNVKITYTPKLDEGYQIYDMYINENKIIFSISDDYMDMDKVKKSVKFKTSAHNNSEK